MDQEEMPVQVDQRPDNTKPQPDTDFDNGTFDFTPLPKSRFGGFNDRLFSLLRPKKPVVQKRQRTGGSAPVAPEVTQYEREMKAKYQPQYNGAPIYQGLPIHPKNTFEIARDQIKNKFSFVASHVFINGIVLIILLVGVFEIYSELPTRPELVIGIVLVSLAGSVLTSRG